MASDPLIKAAMPAVPSVCPTTVLIEPTYNGGSAGPLLNRVASPKNALLIASAS